MKQFTKSITAILLAFIMLMSMSIIAYASFIPVIFETNGGSAVPGQQVEITSLIIRPADPTRSGYTFAGWFADPELSIPWDFNARGISYDDVNPEADAIILYTKWAEGIREIWTLTFQSNGGSAVSNQSVVNGLLAVRPADPTRTNYTFNGWFADPELTVAWDFGTDTVTKATALYARWILNTGGDITIGAAAPTLASSTTNVFKAGTFAGLTVTHTTLTAANASRVKVFYTDDGSDPVVVAVNSTAAPGSAATKELRVHYYVNSGTTQSVEWKIRDAVAGKTYRVVVTSLSGANKSAIASWIHRPPTPASKFDSGAWKTGYLTHAIVHNYEVGSTIHYTMGLAPVAADGTVTTANINAVPNPTTSSEVYNPATGAPIIAGRSATQAVVVKFIAAVPGFTTGVASYYYYNQDNLVMLTDARGKSEAEQLVIINQVIDSMTQTELTQMTGGISSNVQTLNTGAEGRGTGVARLGIPQTMLSDGPAGLRHKKLSTANMCWAGLASTWDVEAYEAAGELVGNEAIYYGIDMVLAPGLNIQRNPFGGRNFEYMSEDPFVSGVATAGYIRGLQSNPYASHYQPFFTLC